jgi:hypothetical protein
MISFGSTRSRRRRRCALPPARSARRGRIWYIRYYDGRGRRRLESTHSANRDDAEKLLRKRLSAKDHGVLPDAAIGTLTLKEATDDLIADYKTNGRRSLPEVKRKIELHLPPYFGERRRMTSITTAEIRAFTVARQEAGASNAEINRELAALCRPSGWPCARADWCNVHTCRCCKSATHERVS